MTDISLLLVLGVFAAAFGLALGWLLRAKVEIATETDPESELRTLRGKQALYASKIRSLHLELAQMESKLATLKAAGVDIGRPVEPVPVDDALMDARLASMIGAFEEEQQADAEARRARSEPSEVSDEPEDEFRSILPADLVEEQSASFEDVTAERRPDVLESDAEPDAGQEGEPPRLVSGELYKRVAAALAHEAGGEASDEPSSEDAAVSAEGEVVDLVHLEENAFEDAGTGGETREGTPSDDRAEESPEDADEWSQADTDHEPAAEISVPPPPVIAEPQPTVPTLRIVPDPAVGHHSANGDGRTIDLREADDLTVIEGVGPKAAELLNGQGITRLDQLADLDDDALEELASGMGQFRTRIVNQGWREQAKAIVEDRSGVSATGG